MSIPLSADSLERAPAPHPAVPESSRSFARRRLLLGVGGVGSSVVASLAWLALLLTGRVVPPSFIPAIPLPEPFTLAGVAVPLVLVLFSVHTLLVLPLEVRGGAVVVRQRPALGAWLAGWLRGVLVQGVLLTLLTALAAVAASYGAARGWPVVFLTLGVGAGSVLLLAMQGAVARCVAPLRLAPLPAALAEVARAQGVRPEAVRVVDAADEAFVGGWIGLRRPVLWVPRAWTDAAHRDVLTVQFARRQAQFASGARRRGLLRAALWPALGVLLFAPLLPWAPTEPTFWLALPAVSTLWMFVGVLLLPSLSRPVVYSADAIAAARLGRETVAHAVRRLDAWQDDEPERTPGVEFTFHPVPSRGNRERALARAPRRILGGAHQLTRLSLYASLAGGGLLGRVVHCNIGRPALWTVYPGD